MRLTSRAAVLVGWALCWLPDGARALDAEVDSETTFRVYDVRSPASPVLWSRRRMIEQLDVALVQPLSAPDRRGEPVRAQGQLSLRLENDFGDTCFLQDATSCFDSTSRGSLGYYEPLARDGRIDLPQAYVELNGLGPGLRLRAGRQLHWDVVGFARIDGASARVEPARWLAFESVAGRLVRASSLAGTDAFAPQGLVYLELDDPTRVNPPHVLPPADTALAGGSFEVGVVEIARTSFTYRKLLDPHGTAQHSAGFGLVSQPVDPLRIDAHAVLDLISVQLVDAEVGARVFTTEATPRVVLRRQVPRFDAGSIWAYFDAAPVWEGSLGVLLQPAAGLELDLALNGRRTDLGPDVNGDDLGGAASVLLHLPRTELSVSGFAWDGGLGSVWGTDLFASRRVVRWLVLELRFSVHRLDDPLREPIEGTSVSETLVARVPIGELSEFSAELSHAHSAPVGNRLQFLASLQLGAWR
jgi:hypothetical protein